MSIGFNRNTNKQAGWRVVHTSTRTGRTVELSSLQLLTQTEAEELSILIDMGEEMKLRLELVA